SSHCCSCPSAREPGRNPGFECSQRSRAWVWNSFRRTRCFYLEGSARRLASLRGFTVTLCADTNPTGTNATSRSIYLPLRYWSKPTETTFLVRADELIE